MYKRQVFNEDLASPDYAPQPSLGLLSAEKAILSRIRFESKRGVEFCVNYTDEKKAEIIEVTSELEGRVDKVETLVGNISSPAVQRVVDTITTLIDLDQSGDLSDGDNILNALNSINENLNTIKETAESALQAAEKAQETADIGVKNAAAAQETADQAVSAAGNAQSTANTAKSQSETNARELASLRKFVENLRDEDTVVDIKAVLADLKAGFDVAAKLAMETVFDYGHYKSGPMTEAFVAETFPAAAS